MPKGDPASKCLMSQLARDFRDGVVDATRVHRAQSEGFEAFDLVSAVGVRPTVLRHVVDLDEAFVRETARAIARSRRAGGRMGRDWHPNSEKIETKEAADDSWVTREDLKPLDEACTKWCSDTFFPDAFARVNMIANVMRLYDMVARVCDLDYKIVFKGGVMMRLIILEFLHDLPVEARVETTKYMCDHRALSLSDFDFEIVPGNHAPPEDWSLRVLALDYAVLLWLQREMQREIEGKTTSRGRSSLLNLEWDRATDTEALRAKLQGVVDELPRDHLLRGATVDRVVLASTDTDPPVGYVTASGKPTHGPRRNVVVYDCEGVGMGDRSVKCVLSAGDFFKSLGVAAKVPVGSGGDCLYATTNTFVAEGSERVRDDQLMAVFHLSRIKHGFLLYYTTASGERRCDRLSGEMIDLSMSCGTAHDERRKYMYESFSRNEKVYRDYPIIGVDPQVAVLRSCTVKGFLHDLGAMIFREHELPWEPGTSSKSPKRLLRYVCFLFIHVLGPHVPGTREEKIASLTKARDLLRRPSVTTVDTGVTDVDEFLNTILLGEGGTPHGPKARGVQETTAAHMDVLLKGCTWSSNKREHFLDVDNADVMASELILTEA